MMKLATQSHVLGPKNPISEVKSGVAYGERTDYKEVKRSPDKYIVAALKLLLERRIDQWGKSAQGARLLDAGCGNQPLRKRVEALGFSYFSQDVRAQTVVQPDFLFPLDGEVPDLLRASPKFQFILCTEVLEHVYDVKKAFSNLSSVLDAKGRILISAPFLFPLHEEPYDYWRFTPHSLARLAEEAGLRVVSFEKGGGTRDFLAQTIGYVLQCWAEVEKGGLFQRAKRYLLRRLLQWTLFLVQNSARMLPPLPHAYLANVIELEKVG